MDPETLYTQIVSGEPSTITGLATDAADRSRSVDRDARNIVDASSKPLATWIGGSAVQAFMVQGMRSYIGAAMASFRLYRASAVLDAAAEDYRTTQSNADEAIGYWRRRPEDSAFENIYRQLTIGALNKIEQDWNRALRDHAADLDEVEEEIERWVGQSAALDYIHYTATDTLPGPRIPGVGLAGDKDGWIAQGLAYDEKTGQYYVSSYQPRDGTDGAQLTTIDAKTGVPGQPVDLGGAPTSDAPGADQGPNHVGGVVVQGNRVLVTSTESAGSFVYIYRKSDLADVRAGEPVEAIDKVPAPASSYASLGPDGELYLGDVDGPLHQVELRDGEYQSVESWDGPPHSNGVAVEPGGVFTFSTQEGRDKRGELITVDSGDDGGISSEDMADADHETINNMSQNLALLPNGRIVTLGESGAEKYSTALDEDDAYKLWGQTHLGVQVNGGDGYQVEPRTLREAARDLGQAESGIDDEHGKVRALTLPASSLGEVSGASTFASKVDRYFDSTAIRLQYSLDALTLSVDGLLAAETLYELTDEEAAADASKILDGML